MELRDLSRLVVRIFALILALKILVEVPWIYSSYLAKGQESTVFLISATILPIVLPLMVSLLLWKFSGIVSDKIAGNVTNIEFPELSFEKSFEFCITLLGVYVCVFAFADLMYHLYFIYEQLGGNPGVVQDPTTYPGLFSTLVEILIGFFMVFGRVGIARFIAKARGRA